MFADTVGNKVLSVLGRDVTAFSGANFILVKGVDAAATYGHTAVLRPIRHRTRQWNNKVRVIIFRRQLVSTEIDDFVTCVVQPGRQHFLQFKPTVIGGDSTSHKFPFVESEAKLKW